MWIRNVLVVASTACTAYSQAAVTPEFEVASIKANHSGRQGYDGFDVDHGSLTVRNVSLKMLIEEAYGTQSERIFGGPSWLASDRFDVIAKGRGDATKSEVRLMLQTLLADRFKLATRREQRELPFYALEIVKGASKLHISKLADGSDATCDPHPTPLGATFKAPCGSFTQAWAPQGAVIVGNRVATADLADALSGFAGRPVLDKTLFKGAIDVDLRWTPEGYSGKPAGDNESQRSAAPPEAGPSLFAAIQEQLGLKLVSATGPIQVLVIERAEKPSEN